MTAEQIVKLLETKHASDVFVPECKNGPTWDGGHSRLDAWAMARSWRHPVMTGYEIKVSRTDFVNDDKWTAYLPLCNHLYFVSPPDVIDVKEVHEGCGLIHVSKTGTRLYVKRRAPRREIDPPVDLLLYVIMRADGFLSDHHQDNISARTVEHWRTWLKDKDERKRVGFEVSQTLQRIVLERITKAEQKNSELQTQIARLENVRLALETAGVPEYNWNAGSSLVAAIHGIPDADFKQLDEAKVALVNLVERWSKIRKGEHAIN